MASPEGFGAGRVVYRPGRKVGFKPDLTGRHSADYQTYPASAVPGVGETAVDSANAKRQKIAAL
jgi:hypothetical protein